MIQRAIIMSAILAISSFVAFGQCATAHGRTHTVSRHASGVSRACAPSRHTSKSTRATADFNNVEHRAFDYFWNESDRSTGLAKDRATNIVGQKDTHDVASIAATGYALTSLPIAVKRHWISNKSAYARALATLRFANDKLPQEHGFYYHFMDMHTGVRVWNSEASSIDTALFVLGALTAGQFWKGTEVDHLAHTIADRVDWPWMQAGGPKGPGDITLAMGWRPKDGWVNARWQGYSEACYMYLLALGSHRNLSPSAWDYWRTETVNVDGYTVFGGAKPIFMAQMTAGYFNLDGLRDRQGRDWWTAWANAHRVDQEYCARHANNKTYADGFWGINASDQPPPVGYGAGWPADGGNNGTVSPTAMLASIMFTPDKAHQALTNLSAIRGKIWGKYGFTNAFNIDKNWYDTDVVGIDLGMEMVAIEDARSGLVWKLVVKTPECRHGLAAAGFKPKVKRF